MPHMIGGLIIKFCFSYFGGQDFMAGQIRPGKSRCLTGKYRVSEWWEIGI